MAFFWVMESYFILFKAVILDTFATLPSRLKVGAGIKLLRNLEFFIFAFKGCLITFFLGFAPI
jgi:hypothetical protein